MLIETLEKQTSVDAAGVLKSFAKGLWGLMSSQPEFVEVTEKPNQNKLKIIKVNVCSNKGLKAIFSEKDRIFTDYKIVQKVLVLCDRSGRIYFLDPISLFITHLPFKGYRDVQLLISNENSLIAFLPKRNLIQAIPVLSKNLDDQCFLELDKAQKFILTESDQTVFLMNN